MATVLAYSWQRNFKIYDRQEKTLTERLAYVSKHHSESTDWQDNVARAIDAGVRGLARGAAWVDRKVIGWLRSVGIVGRRGERGYSSLFDD